MGGPIILVPKVAVPIRAKDLKREMERIGFPLVDSEPFTWRTRLMFNRGLQGGSNFFVLVETAGDRFRAFMMNPEEGREAALLPYGKTVVSVSEGISRKGAKYMDKLVQAVLEQSGKKPPNVYFVQMHFHLGRIGSALLNSPSGELENGERGMLDDGVSSFGSCAINAAFANADHFIQTMHNNFKYNLFLQMKKSLDGAGIVAVPGVEATLPLHFREPWLPGDYTGPNPNPNGPHTLLIAESPELQRELVGKYLPGGYYTYAPSTHALKDMEEVLGQIRKLYGAGVLVALAHPACESRLPDVGFLDRILKGELALGRAKYIIKEHVQAIAHFNATLRPDDLVDFQETRREIERAFKGKNGGEFSRRLANMDEVEGFASYLLNKWGAKYGKRLSKNTLNMAFAEEMSEKFGTVKFFESDSHDQNRLYFFLLGGRVFYWTPQVPPFGKGHTRLWLPEGENRRISSRELVGLFHRVKSGEEKGARIGAQVYSDMRDGVPVISEQRERMTGPQWLFDKLEKFYYYLTKQGIVLANDAWKAILRKAEKEPMGFVDADIANSARGSIYWP